LSLISSVCCLLQRNGRRSRRRGLGGCIAAAAQPPPAAAAARLTLAASLFSLLQDAHVEEVGPRSDHEGPCLAVFRGVRMSQARGRPPPRRAAAAAHR
jgi:hypothetical protein